MQKNNKREKSFFGKIYRFLVLNIQTVFIECKSQNHFDCTCHRLFESKTFYSLFNLLFIIFLLNEIVCFHELRSQNHRDTWNTPTFAFCAHYRSIECLFPNSWNMTDLPRFHYFIILLVFFLVLEKSEKSIFAYLNGHIRSNDLLFFCLD